MDNASAVSGFVGGNYLVKSKMRNDKALNSPQANWEKTFHGQMLMESLCILRKNTFYNCSSASGLFLIFHQISGSCSYKITHINKECNTKCHFRK